MWYMLGRASDLSLVQKQHVSVCSRNVFFIRLVRVKTSEEQGLTIYPDKDITTCPILAVAVALAMQVAPNVQLLDHIELGSDAVELTCLETLPLSELLVQAASEDKSKTKSKNEGKSKKKNPATTQESQEITPKKAAPQLPNNVPSINTHVNRLLDRIGAAAGVAVPLSSHSFRRGGAQHANGDPQLSAQWIFDRGAWNMTSTNKAFAYVFNTTQEDQRVSKVLSGWRSDETVPLEGLERFDAQSTVAARRLQGLLFNTCSGLEQPHLNLCPRALDVCTTRLFRAYPQLKVLSAHSPVVARLEACAAQAKVSEEQLLRWSTALEESCDEKEDDNEEETAKEASIKRHHLAVIQALLLRIEAIEKKTAPTTEAVQPTEVVVSDQEPAKPRKKAPATYLSSVWFEWYAGEPRLWNCADRKKKSDAKLIVAFMKLFLVNGFKLCETDADYPDRVLDLGKEAERKLLAFLVGHGIRSKGSTAVLKHMRELHRRGLLNGMIADNNARIAVGQVDDPSPRATHNVLQHHS